MVFKSFIEDIDINTECTVSKFADGTKLSGATDTKEGRDLDRIEKWAHKCLMGSNKAKCNVLYLDCGNRVCLQTGSRH